MVVRLFRYWASDQPPERKAFLRAAAAVMIAFVLGTFIIFLRF
jgi:hypothetical protein